MFPEAGSAVTSASVKYPAETLHISAPDVPSYDLIRPLCPALITRRPAASAYNAGSVSADASVVEADQVVVSRSPRSVAA